MHSYTASTRLLIAAAAVGLLGCSDPTMPPPPVTITVDPTTDGQSGVVGTTLTQALRVTVQSDGTPSAGVTVTWQVSEGRMAPVSSITDAAGIATATWTLGQVAGTVSAVARVPDRVYRAGVFRATALPGPVAGIARAGGDVSSAQVLTGVQRSSGGGGVENFDQFYGAGVQNPVLLVSVDRHRFLRQSLSGSTLLTLSLRPGAGPVRWESGRRPRWSRGSQS